MVQRQPRHPPRRTSGGQARHALRRPPDEALPNDTRSALLYSNTFGGGTSVSFALRGAGSTADMCATMLGGTMQGDGLRPHDGGASHNSGPRAKPRASPPRRALRLSLASAPAAKAAAPAAKPRGRATTKTRWARKARTDCPVWWEGTRGGSLARTTPVADAVSSHARISTREWRAFTNTMDSGARSVELFHLGLPLSCQIARDSVVVLGSLSLRPRR